MQQPMEFVNHVSDHDLERYYLGMVKDEAELASLEEHLLACPACVERAESTQDYVDAVRAALVTIRED
jgi:anti-sigma factor RsiW